MNVLFDLGHPAHFHLFKGAMACLESAGHGVHIIARQKDCLVELLEASGRPFHLIRRRRRTLPVLALETLHGIHLAMALARRHRVGLMVGTSFVIGPASRLTGATSVVFSQDDAAVVPLLARLAYPVAHYVVTPRFLAHEDGGPKRLTYPGNHQFAYLHPSRYRPDPGIRDVLGLRPGERYFLIRLVELTAHHDVGERGLSAGQVDRLVDVLGRHGKVFLSSESPLEGRLRPLRLPAPPQRIFDVLAFAHLFVGDSQTMATEAALLGTPVLRCNTFRGRISCMEEMEHRYGLMSSFVPAHFDDLMARLEEWLARPDLKEQWRAKRDAMARDCVDLTQWMVDLFLRLGQK
jgi:predicted glycosyltransferase